MTMKPFTLLCVMSAEGFDVPDLGVKTLQPHHTRAVIKDCVANPLGETESLEQRIDRLNLWWLDSPAKTWGLVKAACAEQDAKFWASASKNYKVYLSLVGKLRSNNPGIDLEACEELIHYWKGRQP